MFRHYKMMLLFIAAVQMMNVAASMDDGTQQEWGVDQWMASCNCKNDRNIELFKEFSAFSRELINNCSNKEKRWKSEQIEFVHALHQLNQSHAQAAAEWRMEKLDLSEKLQNNAQEMAKLQQGISKQMEAEESLHQLNQSYTQAAIECRNEKLQLSLKLQTNEQELTKLKLKLNDQFIKYEALLEEIQISIIDKTSYEKITPICKAIYNAKCVEVRCYDVKMAQDMKEINLLKAIVMYDELITKLTPCLNAANVQQLVDEKADIDIILKESLFAAAKDGNVEAIRNLIENGVNVNATDENKNSALILASWKRHTAIVKLLIDAGAYLDAQNRDRFTALIQAAENNHTEICEILLDAGADANIKNLERYTALTYVIIKCNLNVVKKLAEKGAEVNVAADGGNTPLHTAARYGYIDIAKVLVEHGARLNVTNNERKTPLDRALIYNQAQMVMYLMSIGATE